MTNNATYQPTEIWTPESPSFDFGEAVEKAHQEINSKNPDQLLHQLKNSVERSDNGVVYAVLNGDIPEEYSDTDALVMFNPFANTATSNMLVRAEFIREVAKHANVRDENGKLKPVIMLASPGIFGSRLNLSKEDRNNVRKGNLGPAAKEFLKAVTSRRFGRVALLGYSQGADLALAGAKSAYSGNLDVSSVSIGDPTGVKKRSRSELGIDFFAATKDLETQAQRSGLLALDKARGMRDYMSFIASIPFPLNWNDLWRGLGNDTFENNAQDLLNEGRIEALVTGYGSNTKISQPTAIEPSLANLQQNINAERLTSIKIQNGTHAWGEFLPLLAKLYLRALV